VPGGNLRGEVAVGDDGREGAAVGDGDEVGRMGVGEEVEGLAVARIDGDDRFLFEDKIGEDVAELRALVLDGGIGVLRGADAG